jgi:hypothetical protein
MNKLDALPELNRVYIFKSIDNAIYTITDPWF